MDKQQQMLMSAERAIKRLAKIFKRRDIDPENLADWMIQSDKLGECRADDVSFVAECLMGPLLACVVCGKDSHRLEVRRHARDCSDKCRQKPYRQRNGSGKNRAGKSVMRSAVEA